MARYIHCEECKNNMQQNAQSYGELYECIEGTALFDMFCDGASCIDALSPAKIKTGDKCFAAVLLPDKSHHNYHRQKPEKWAHGYLKIKT